MFALASAVVGATILWLNRRPSATYKELDKERKELQIIQDGLTRTMPAPKVYENIVRVFGEHGKTSRRLGALRVTYENMIQSVMSRIESYASKYRLRHSEGIASDG